MGLLDFLHWGRADDTVDFSGSQTVADFYSLEIGQSVLVSIDHSDQGKLWWAEAPRIYPEAGCVALLDLAGTNGTGFTVLLMRVAGSPPYGYSPSDMRFNWIRRGGGK
jgi:hypothetical protein